MKVKDLIEKLKAMDPNATVILASSNFEHRGAHVELSLAHQFDEGSHESKQFRDAFDGDTYHKEVWSIIGGNEHVVYLS